MTRVLPSRWQDLTSPEIEALPTDTVAALVLGAVEQHGPHLPLSTDLDIGEGLLEAAVAQLPAGFPLVTLPALAIGASEEHLHFPGTLSLPAETLVDILEAHGAALARWGLGRLVLVNAHGGNNAAIDIAALRLRRKHGLIVTKYHYPRSPAPDLPSDVLPASELRHGLHGGAVETAMMRHLMPERVRTARLERHPSSGEALAADGLLTGPEAEGNLAWLAEDLNPGGVAGDARLGTPELGAQLLHHYAGRLVRLLQDARTFRHPAGKDQS